MILNQLGILGTPYTCLHAILGILQRNLDNGFKESPQIIEECYHVIYKLCSSTETCNATIRYLRNNHEFFTKHLIKMPFIEGSNINFFMFIGIVYLHIYIFFHRYSHSGWARYSWSIQSNNVVTAILVIEMHCPWITVYVLKPSEIWYTCEHRNVKWFLFVQLNLFHSK